MRLSPLLFLPTPPSFHSLLRLWIPKDSLRDLLRPSLHVLLPTILQQKPVSLPHHTAFSSPALFCNEDDIRPTPACLFALVLIRDGEGRHYALDSFKIPTAIIVSKSRKGQCAEAGRAPRASSHEDCHL